MKFSKLLGIYGFLLFCFLNTVRGQQNPDQNPEQKTQQKKATQQKGQQKTVTKNAQSTPQKSSRQSLPLKPAVQQKASVDTTKNMQAPAQKSTSQNVQNQTSIAPAQQQKAAPAQTQDLLQLLGEERPHKEYIANAFKSTRVISGQSMEFLGAGVLDFRILHRFGLVNEGVSNFYGFDEAKMRLGLDYGISRNLMVGIGRSTLGKELDGFIKFRPVWQSKGPGSFPFSIVLVTSMTLDPTKAPPSDTLKFHFFTSRLNYYNAIIIGRKFSEAFSLQLTPEMVHQNLVDSVSTSNDVYALGIGARIKLSRRVAFVVDYHYIAYGLKKGTYSDPLSIGFDIETGGHVFQLHFSNSQGMNERALLLGTTDQWSKGAIRFGFNLSRVFTISKPKSLSHNR
ncbi:MAG TPA: DUF5777 family beta-barrel protein [Puia sp.]|nr:DUF5777 family beta-barrel protein [Puia sp.]